jgi:hypothetical protein
VSGERNIPDKKNIRFVKWEALCGPEIYCQALLDLRAEI